MNWISDVLVPLAITAIPVLFGFLMKWAASKVSKNEAMTDFVATLDAVVYRIRDKVIVDIEAAKRPESEGGAEITKEEWSAIRQRAFEMLMANLKGPALDLAKGFGETVVKGWISKKLDGLVGGNKSGGN